MKRQISDYSIIPEIPSLGVLFNSASKSVYESLFGSDEDFFRQAQQRLAMQDNTTGISPLLNTTPSQPTLSDRMQIVLKLVGITGVTGLAASELFRTGLPLGVLQQMIRRRARLDV